VIFTISTRGEPDRFLDISWDITALQLVRGWRVQGVGLASKEANMDIFPADSAVFLPLPVFLSL